MASGEHDYQPLPACMHSESYCIVGLCDGHRFLRVRKLGLDFCGAHLCIYPFGVKGGSYRQKKHM